MHSWIPPERDYAYLTWQDIKTLSNKENVVIVLPIGAIEQHGPHLPLVVDAAISIAVLGKALGQLEPTIPVYALPPLYYGKSNEHWHFPGTLTLSAETLLHLVRDIAESLHRSGFRKLVLMNSHGGQPQIMEIVARDLHQAYADFMVFPFFTWRVPHIAGDLLSEQEKILGIHAGDAETSLMLAILPDQVRMEKAVKEYPQGLPEQSLLSMEGALPFAWMTRDLSRSGVLGDATTATREKGEQILNSLADGWVVVLRDVYAFRQPHVWKGNQE